MIYSLVRNMKKLSPYLFMLYIAWSVCVDVTALGVLLWYFFK